MGASAPPTSATPATTTSGESPTCPKPNCRNVQSAPDLSSSKAKSALCTSSIRPPERSSRSAAASAGTRTRSDQGNYVGQVRNSQVAQVVQNVDSWQAIPNGTRFLERIKWIHRGKGAPSSHLTRGVIL